MTELDAEIVLIEDDPTDAELTMQALRGQKLTERIRWIALTSSAQQKDRIQCYKLGANSYVVKPVKFDEYSATVSQIALYWMRVNRSPCL